MLDEAHTRPQGPTLADRGEFIAFESSFYCVMKREKVLMHRPNPFDAPKPNEVYSWDIMHCQLGLQTSSFPFFE